MDKKPESQPQQTPGKEAPLAPLLLPTSHTNHHQVLFLQPQHRYSSSHSQQLSPFYHESLSFNPRESMLLPISLHTEAGLSLTNHVPPSCLNPSIHYFRAENQVLHGIYTAPQSLASYPPLIFSYHKGSHQATQLLWIPPSPSSPSYLKSKLSIITSPVKPFLTS